MYDKMIHNVYSRSLLALLLLVLSAHASQQHVSHHFSLSIHGTGARTDIKNNDHKNSSVIPKSCPSVRHNEHNTLFIWKNRLHQVFEHKDSWFEIQELNKGRLSAESREQREKERQFVFKMRKDIVESGIALDWVFFTKKDMYESGRFAALQMNSVFDRNANINISSSSSSSRSLPREFFDEFFDMEVERNNSRKLAVFRQVVTNKFGLIVNLMDGCNSAVRNGGCFHMHHSKIYQYGAGAGSYQVYDSVISLTAGASGTWHFPMELLVALANIGDESIIKKSFIHVTSRTSFVVSWLTALGIEPDRIIDSTVIAAKELYVPEMGRCGAPFLSQLNWLQDRMAMLYPNPNPNNASDANSVVLIRRTRSRTVSNHMQVENTVKSFSAARGLPLQLHSDDHLPSLVDQIRIFSRARIVVAPHGAGELFINFLPPNSCVVELISASNTCLAYSRIAYVKRMHYIQCFMDANHANRVDEKELAGALDECFRAVHETGKI